MFQIKTVLARCAHSVATSSYLLIIVVTMGNCNAHLKNDEWQDYTFFYKNREVVPTGYLEKISDCPPLFTDEDGRVLQGMITMAAASNSIEDPEDYPTKKAVKNQGQAAVMFCGNPGVGKSSLCNSIFQQVVFSSGVSIGSGLTTSRQEYIYRGRKYIDTPGLSDIKLKEQAANEIEQALKENSDCKVIFVITLEGGRIRPDDLTTINTICEAVTVDFRYGIIINKVTQQVAKRTGTTPESWAPYWRELKKQPSSILIIEKHDDMDDIDNVLLPIHTNDRKKLLKFIDALPSNIIQANQVQAITDAHEKERLKMEEEVRRAQQRLEELRREFAREEERRRELERDREWQREWRREVNNSTCNVM